MEKPKYELLLTFRDPFGYDIMKGTVKTEEEWRKRFNSIDGCESKPDWFKRVETEDSAKYSEEDMIAFSELVVRELLNHQIAVPYVLIAEHLRALLHTETWRK